jgi:hypothetical protein
MAAGGFSPSMLSGLEAFYDLKDPSSYTTDTGVKLLSDKSGNSGVNVLALNGAVGNYASASDSAAISVTGDLDVRCNLQMVDWTTGASTYFISKWVTTGNQRAYVFGISTSGTLEFSWSSLGSDTITKLSTSAVPFSDLASGWIRATLDVDNGAAGNDVIFYTSTDGVTWSQLGTTVTTAGTTSIFDSTAVLNLGQINADTNRLNGLLYRCQIYAGLTGSDLRFDANFATASKLATSFSESSSNAATVTINSTGDLGARICGARDLVQMTAANQPIPLSHSGTNYGYLNGVAGNYFSSPDSVPTSIVGDLDVRFEGALTDWTPAALTDLFSKWGSVGNYSWTFEIQTNGVPRFAYSTDGTAITNRDATAAPTVTNGDRLGLRVTMDVDNGAGGNTVTFYTRTDGLISENTGWTQLGTAVTNAGVTSIFNGTSSVQVSGRDATNGMITGTAYRAQMYSGIAGTLAFDFNPATYVSGTTFADSSSNAATITLNGGATIVTRTIAYFDGTNDYMKAAAAFSLAQPTTVYFVGQQNTWTDLDSIYDGNATTSMRLLQSGLTPSIIGNAGNGFGATTSPTLATNYVISTVFNGVSSSLRLNRAFAITGNAGASNANGFTLAAQGDGSNRHSNINVLGVLIYSGAHDTATQNRVALWASRYYGLAGV